MQSVNPDRAYYNLPPIEQEHEIIYHIQYLIWLVVPQYDRDDYVHAPPHEAKEYLPSLGDGDEKEAQSKLWEVGKFA